MQLEFQWDSREFERALHDISRESDRTDFEIITMNAKTLVKAVRWNTPRDTGTTEAGLWPAWEALDMPGSPSRRKYAAWTRRYARSKTERRYVPVGKVDDQRRAKGEKYFEFVNRTFLIDKRGKKINYPYILNEKINFIGRAEAEATYKFGRGYERLLRKHGKL